jgi:hypothetical protein
LYPSDPSCQPCPDCAGLQCLCRPRFFAGQLLTEDDLNRLDQYITAKNQLHNRYLFGSGVVCGLEVRCNPCADVVTVTPGYALSPCGDDIIVCRTDTVDICTLIAQCTRTTAPDCSPYAGGDVSCQDLAEDWVLAIRYAESPSRGITALTGAGQTCCSCGKANCPGAIGTGSCGCAGTSSSAGCCGPTMTPAPPITTKRPQRNAPPACEPTVTCEGYRYEVFRAPTAAKGVIGATTVSGLAGLSSVIGGALFQRLACCVDDLVMAIGPLPGVNATPQAWYQWCYRTKQALIEHFGRYPDGDCAVVYKLQNLACPDPNAQDFQQLLAQMLLALTPILLEGLVGCLCSALLPPCLDAGDPRVPLALISVRKSDCTILSVCNWTPQRKHVLTFPTLSYWLGWLPFSGIIREWLHAICCNLLGLSAPSPAPPPPPVGDQARTRAAMPAGVSTEPGSGIDPLSQPIELNVGQYAPNSPAGNVTWSVLLNLMRPAAVLTSNDLATAVFNPVYVGTGAPTTQSDEIARLMGEPSVKFIAEALRPLGGVVPKEFLGSMLGTFRPAPPSPSPPTPPGPPSPPMSPADFAALRAELAALQQTVAAQQAQLDALRNPPPRR